MQPRTDYPTINLWLIETLHDVSNFAFCISVVSLGVFVWLLHIVIPLFGDRWFVRLFVPFL